MNKMLSATLRSPPPNESKWQVNSQPRFLVMSSVKGLGGPAERVAHPTRKRVGVEACAKETAFDLLMEGWGRSHQRGGCQVKEVEDIPGRGQNMSKADRHESAGYFWRTVIRLERLEDRIKENGGGGRKKWKVNLGQDEEAWMPCQNCLTWSRSDGTLTAVLRLNGPSSDAVAVWEMEKRWGNLHDWEASGKSRGRTSGTWAISGAGIKRRAGFKSIVCLSICCWPKWTVIDSPQPMEISPKQTIPLIHFWISVHWFTFVSLLALRLPLQGLVPAE